MKTLLATLSLVALCGCDAPNNSTEVESYGNKFAVVTVTNNGHLFAVVTTGTMVGICEVTDASLIEKK